MKSSFSPLCFPASFFHFSFYIHHFNIHFVSRRSAKQKKQQQINDRTKTEALIQTYFIYCKFLVCWSRASKSEQSKLSRSVLCIFVAAWLLQPNLQQLKTLSWMCNFSLICIHWKWKTPWIPFDRCDSSYWDGRQFLAFKAGLNVISTFMLDRWTVF